MVWGTPLGRESRYRSNLPLILPRRAVGRRLRSWRAAPMSTHTSREFHMHLLKFAAIASAFVALPVSSGAPARSAVVVSAADVASLLKSMPATSVSDQQMRMIDAGGYNVGVGVVQRPQVATQTAIEHDKLTEVYYVLEGSGTLVTGGAITNAKPIPSTSRVYKDLAGPGDIGSAIDGGERRRVSAGDVVIIPSGVPHWFSDVQGTIRYMVVRVDPERVLTTK